MSSHRAIIERVCGLVQAYSRVVGLHVSVCLVESVCRWSPVPANEITALACTPLAQVSFAGFIEEESNLVNIGLSIRKFPSRTWDEASPGLFCSLHVLYHIRLLYSHIVL